MQPDHAAPTHWNSSSQSWFPPSMNSHPFFPMPGFHSDPSSEMSSLPEHTIHNPSGEFRIPPHQSPCAMQSSLSPSYPTPINGYYSLSPGSQNIMASRPNPHRSHVFQHGVVNAVDLEQDYLSQLFEKTKPSNAEDPTASCASKTSGLRFIDDKITRPQRGRTVFSAKQLHELEKVFITDQYISGQQRRRLSGQLGLTETQVRVWFQNRRIKWRKQKLERKIKL